MSREPFERSVEILKLSLKLRLEQEISKLPKVSTQTGGPDQIYVTTRLTKLFGVLSLADAC